MPAIQGLRFYTKQRHRVLECKRCGLNRKAEFKLLRWERQFICVKED